MAAWHFSTSTNMNGLINSLQTEGIIRSESVIKGNFSIFSPNYFATYLLTILKPSYSPQGMKSVDRAFYCLKSEDNPYVDAPSYIGEFLNLLQVLF